MSRSLFFVVLLGACTPRPVVTGSATSSDGNTAWFAVTEGDEVTFYRCERSACAVVPRSDAPVTVTPDPEPEPEPETSAEREPEPSEEPGDEPAATEDDNGYPDEERLDLMNGVI